MEKSIFEPLSLDELQKQIKKDSLFGRLYDKIQEINSSLKTDSEKAKYSSITYSKICDIVKIATDTSIFNNFRKEWINLYSGYSSKVDSIVNYWEGVKKEYSLDQYIKIELSSIETEYYSFGGVENVSLGFKMTPLKGNIQQVRFGFSIEPKLYNNDTYHKSMSWCLYTKPLSKQTIGYWEANYEQEKKLAGESLSTIKRDYDVHIEVDKIRMNGKNMSVDDLNIPNSVNMYMKYGSLYEDDVIVEFIDLNYKDIFSFIQEKTKNIMKEKDPLVFDYIQLISK